MFFLFGKRAVKVPEKGEFSINFRSMLSKDFKTVSHIEQRSFPDPWTENEFLHNLDPENNCLGFVAEYKGKVTGFIICRIYREKIEILNMAVHPNWKGRGIGREMIKRIAEGSFLHGRYMITVQVDERNLDSQLFFKACGFRATNVVRGFYGSDHDAYSMQYNIGSQGEKQFLPVNEIAQLTR